MEIIRQGYLPSTRTFIGTCTNCQCVVRCPATQLTRIWIDAREGEQALLDCPTPGCPKQITMKAELTLP